ncbi:hypothetical protein E3N88_30649 [Mikania micrantha]|uniref:Uncharacterized protein n=1 Tax=Mikania micrantha TaxID=192012 RepID=A0A5N6MM92_9ASTR|nr:hypothetical protein E3N88_30649 [Mikania micrantha]
MKSDHYKTPLEDGITITNKMMRIMADFVDDIDIEEELLNIEQTPDVNSDDAVYFDMIGDPIHDLNPADLNDQPLPYHVELVDANFFNSFEDDFDDTDVL